MGYEKLGGFKYRDHAVLVLTTKDAGKSPFRYQVIGPHFSTYQDAYTIQQIHQWIKLTIDQAIRRKRQKESA